MNLITEIRTMRSGGLTYPEIAKVLKHATAARMILDSESRLTAFDDRLSLLEMRHRLETRELRANLTAAEENAIDAIEETRQELAEQAQETFEATDQRLTVLEDIQRKKSCLGKVAHPEKATATAALNKLRQQGRVEGILRVYRCPFGDHYHVGHALGQNARSVA